MAEDSNNEDVEEIEVKHTFSDSYRLIPANGVDGGLQPQGELKIDFTYDHNYRTTSEMYDPENGILTGLTMEGHMEREHQVGITMDPEQAREVAIWILDKTLGENVTREEIIEGIQRAVDSGATES